MAIVRGKPMFFKNNKAQSAENDLLLLCSRHAPASPIEGPLCLEIEYVWPWRKTETKARMRYPKLPMTSKPDCDNMAKMLGDVLTKLKFYNDDSQVVRLVVSKFWGHQVGVTVQLSPFVVGDAPTRTLTVEAQLF